jgi:hypothetical protein
VLEKFVAWTKIIADNLPPSMRGIVSVGTQSDNQSARIDIETPLAIGRITFWKSGDYITEIIDIAKEKIIYSHQGCIDREDAFSETFLPFFSFLKSMSAGN